MDRTELRTRLGGGATAVLPVLQVRAEARAVANAAAAVEAGAPGLFLINHGFDPRDLIPVIGAVRAAHPDLWLGVNLRGQPARLVFPVLGKLASDGVRVDAAWCDDAEIVPRAESQPDAEAIAESRRASGWEGLYFGGVALTAERPVPPADLGLAAGVAARWTDVVTTALSASAGPRDRAKLIAVRKGLGDAALAIGSGITAETVPVYALHADCLLVARAASRPEPDAEGEQVIDPERLGALIASARNAAPAA